MDASSIGAAGVALTALKLAYDVPKDAQLKKTDKKKIERRLVEIAQVSDIQKELEKQPRRIPYIAAKRRGRLARRTMKTRRRAAPANKES
jgi:hypothetical protein